MFISDICNLCVCVCVCVVSLSGFEGEGDLIE